MDHNIKRKLEKPRLVRSGKAWICYCPAVLVADKTGRGAYLQWKAMKAENVRLPQ